MITLIIYQKKLNPVSGEDRAYKKYFVVQDYEQIDERSFNFTGVNEYDYDSDPQCLGGLFALERISRF